MITFSHNLLTGRHTTFDHHIVVLLGTQFDKTPLHGRIPAHHINISTTLLDDDRLLRRAILSRPLTTKYPFAS